MYCIPIYTVTEAFIMHDKKERQWAIVKITDIRVRKITTDGKMKAIVSVTFDNEFVVHDIKIIEGQEKLFIAMPSRRTPDGEFKDIAHPINGETRSYLEQAILEKYDEVLNEEEPAIEE